MAAQTWHYCYKDSWQDIVVPSSFKHPAKFARGLIHRLYRYLLDQGYVQLGATILDPFGGVALGALDAQTYGLRWVGVELEPHFVVTAQHNLDLWARQYGFTQAAIYQGDSRQLRAVLAGHGVQGCVSSPPYAGGGQLMSPHNGIDWSKTTGTGKQLTPGRAMLPYGSSPGQLGAMAPGSVEAIVSSPPYAEGCRHTGGPDPHPEHIQSRNKQTLERYGSTPGQLGSLPSGSLDAVVSSPPYATGDTAGAESLQKRSDKSAQAMRKAQGWTGGGQTSPQNLARQSRETFWAAAHQVMEEVAALLPPGAIAAWVLKHYVAKKQLVDFPGQWAMLCQYHGLALAETIQATLIEELGTQETLWGEPETLRSETKSFFRRLAEKKGSPRIDYETVLITRKEAA